MSSLERLIKLAKRTGDRLIIHDPVDGNDIVVMDLDAYEMLMDTQIDLFDSLVEDHEPICSNESDVIPPPVNLTPEDFNEELDTKREDLVEAIHALDQLMDEPEEDKESEPEIDPKTVEPMKKMSRAIMETATVGDVLKEMAVIEKAQEEKKQELPEDYDENSIINEYPEIKESTPKPVGHLPKNWAPTSDVLKRRFPNMNLSRDNSVKSSLQADKATAEAPITIERLPYDKVPFKPQENIGELDEKRLDDDPVFLEEPI